MPDTMSEYMSDRMPPRMPERMPRRSDGLPEYMPRGMPDRMPENMSDRMPEYMSERMPGRLLDSGSCSPKTPYRVSKNLKKPYGDVYQHIAGIKYFFNCINVTVGITRSNVFFVGAMFAS